MGETRLVTAGNKYADALIELMKVPLDESLLRLIPETTSINEVTVENGLVKVDLSDDFLEDRFHSDTGDIRPDQNNFCGMGATGGGIPGNSFATEELGIIAHYAHLAWYYYPDHVNQYCSSTYDPRPFGSYHYKYTGDTTLGFLNGRWTPGVNYTDKIIQFANQIYGF